MQHIKNILNKHLKQTGLSKNIETALIIEEFLNFLEKEFGSIILKKIKPLYIKNGILSLACVSPAVVQEVNFKKEFLIDKINQKFRGEPLKDIKFIL
ncbi:MAG TPA: DUF721 domain-containing protein [Candidatus Uhrbacteria bacterium]|nr:DUF721 domain-containing protein [Candidatus Uhrbacteria bacterium]